MNQPSKTVLANVDLLIDRERVGIAKYGQTVDDAHLNQAQWLQHLLEELLDGANYAQRTLQMIGQSHQEYALLKRMVDGLHRAMREPIQLRVGSRVPSNEFRNGVETCLEILREQIDRYEADQILRESRRSC